MRKLISAVVLASAVCCAAAADPVTPRAAPPSIKVPAEDVVVRPGRIVVLKVETDAVRVTWIYCGEDDDVADLVPGADGKTAAFASPTPGRYAVHVVAAGASGELTKAKMFVTVGKAGPPRPTDPFVLAVKEAAAKETDAAATAVAVKGLSEVYAAGAKFAADPAVAKWGDLFNRMAKEANDRKLGGKVPAVQAVVQAELKKRLVGADGTPVKMDADLDADGRTKAVNELSRVAAALAAAN